MNKKILVCDDDQEILEMIQLVLEDEETTVISVFNSMTVLAEVDAHKPDMLLLDLWMPIITGDQIVRQLRNDEEYKQLPIVVMSASRDGMEIANKSGATDYIAKPFDIDELINKVNKYTR